MYSDEFIEAIYKNKIFEIFSNPSFFKTRFFTLGTVHRPHLATSSRSETFHQLVSSAAMDLYPPVAASDAPA